MQAGAERSRLQELERQAGENLPLGETALLLSCLSRPGLDPDPYTLHFQTLAKDVAGRHLSLLEAGAGDTAQTRIAALKHVIADQNAYRGAEEAGDLRNADIAAVVDRRQGLPVALAILTLEAARAQGWNAEGLNFPGHFLSRLEYKGTRLIFDPFHQFALLEAPELRSLIKEVAGPQAELSASFYQPVSNRDILMRLQNNIKLRQIESEKYAEALETVEIMRLFAPRETRLLLDAGVLYARTGRREEALTALEAYIRDVPSPKDRADALLLLQNLLDAPPEKT